MLRFFVFLFCGFILQLSTMGVSQNSGKYDVFPMQLDRFYFPGGVGSS